MVLLVSLNLLLFSPLFLLFLELLCQIIDHGQFLVGLRAHFMFFLVGPYQSASHQTELLVGLVRVLLNGLLCANQVFGFVAYPDYFYRLVRLFLPFLAFAPGQLLDLDGGQGAGGLLLPVIAHSVEHLF